MKYILVLLLFSTSIYATKKNTQVVKTMTTAQKKQKFIKLLLPVIKKVHAGLLKEYKEISKNIKTSKDLAKTKILIEKYRVSNTKELLIALKPHPVSIVLAQAAIESAWGTSRFFKKANNVFGMWSYNKNEPRIAALKKRGNTTIWLKKFNSIENSVQAYYKSIATGKAYAEFRALRMKTDDVFLLSKKLNKYCELGAEYCSRIERVIRYNKFRQYD